jgi:hypothetical protein
MDSSNSFFVLEDDNNAINIIWYLGIHVLVFFFVSDKHRPEKQQIAGKMLLGEKMKSQTRPTMLTWHFLGLSHTHVQASIRRPQELKANGQL